ncbi:MAG: NusG domain II-containing protein [Synergistaceae bacterium]|jgi:hypothetical protein|nr:NusG domain II-containing protein [Synergistaceae bacterium]
MKLGDKILYAGLSIIFLISCAASIFFLRGSPNDGDKNGANFTLEIVSRGEIIKSFDMPDLSETESGSTIELREGGGFNILSIEDGAVRMVSSDCPGGDCLRMPPIWSDGRVIVCLPHKLVIRLRRDGNGEVDAVSY